jgi:hypothetical protein
MKKILFFIALTISVSAFSQNEEVMKKLKEAGITSELLSSNLKDSDAEYFYDVKITTVNSSETKVEECKFDPTKKIGERWILKTVNGGTPSKKDLKNFDKAHNTKQPDINGKVDESSWGIEKDDADYLVVSFKYDKTSLPKKYTFLGDCKGLAYFNKKSKSIEKAEFVNEGPLKIKIFNVTKLDMVVRYIYNKDAQTFLVKEEDLDMQVKLLGQLVDIKEKSEFSNYKKK